MVAMTECKCASLSSPEAGDHGQDRRDRMHIRLAGDPCLRGRRGHVLGLECDYAIPGSGACGGRTGCKAAVVQSIALRFAIGIRSQLSKHDLDPITSAVTPLLRPSIPLGVVMLRMSYFAKRMWRI